MNSSEYKSPLEHWYEQAGVRSGERRILNVDTEISDIYYPPELAPVTNHPFVRAQGEDTRKRLLVRHLYVYLDAIERLEHEIVNEVTFKIARQNIGIPIPVPMRLDAYKIYTDEAYHMLFSADLNEQIIVATGVSPILAEPAYVSYLPSLTEKYGVSYQTLILTLLSVITETMISSVLLEIPKDKRVVETVRNLVRDHAEDEGRHSKFFSILFERLWPALSPRERTMMGPLLPQLIRSFSRPNLEAIRKILMAEGFSDDVARGILEESYPEEDLGRSAYGAAQATVRMFERMGVMEDPHTADEFQRCLLWTPRG